MSTIKGVKYRKKFNSTKDGFIGWIDTSFPTSFPKKELNIYIMPLIYDFNCQYCGKGNTSFYSAKKYCDNKCMKKSKNKRYRSKYPEKERLRAKKYYQKYYLDHKESYCLRKKQHLKINPDYYKVYYKAHKEKYKENREKFSEDNPNYHKQWQERNRERIKMYWEKQKNHKELEFKIMKGFKYLQKLLEP